MEGTVYHHALVIEAAFIMKIYDLIVCVCGGWPFVSFCVCVQYMCVILQGCGRIYASAHTHTHIYTHTHTHTHRHTLPSLLPAFHHPAFFSGHSQLNSPSLSNPIQFSSKLRA